MSWKTKTWGGTVGVVGFLLSPLSWWNDALINLPLALGFGWAVAWFYPPAFKLAVVIGYWLTNVLGFWMIHRGIETALKAPRLSPAGAGGDGDDLTLALPLPVRRPWFKDLLIASAYTAMILLLMKLDVLKPLPDLSL